MFVNVGKKIKMAAKICTIVGMVLSTISGIALIALGISGSTGIFSIFLNIFFGLVVIGIGCLISWVGSFLVYGFGQLVDNTDIIAQSKK